ncbi:MAG: SIS domain-containing protein [Dehalococcoidia bacterium]
MTIPDRLQGRLTGYVEAVAALDLDASAVVLDLLEQVRASGSTLYVCGNGGSASSASHFVTDLVKATMLDGVEPLRAFSLGDNPALLTALANDLAYDRVFAEPLRAYARPGDVLVVVTASGNSPNVVQALEAARDLGLRTVALTGFSGGAARELADVVIHVPVDDYGVVECAHSVIMHILAFTLRERLEEGLGLTTASARA